ncbi:hypothetical protein [Paenibacillus mucilaginosus]|uniref:Uncharacterized protein n=1 Tax=Paenibacillus mucilaginosus K02 TaxID=997761 RepID=R9UPH7_9BACL|nr:hypothetical protein [Paenibacillus mucilaginosus]AGN70727.1 hypothetical protein B2K_39640 [Paenibacillus mucilaginosus K02]MCG7215972.1 hypothetical protein [Paenibacillus mucilaginosus]WDM24657.1 hypothetical protein KCX80_19335 [Paenibacillus mucilaginosus]
MTVHLLNMASEGITGVHVAYDSRKHRVHLLNLNDEADRDIRDMIQLIQPLILQKLFKHTENPGVNIEWVLYSPNGCIFRYDEGAFVPLQPQHPDLYGAFVKKLNLLTQCNKLAIHKR